MQVRRHSDQGRVGRIALGDNVKQRAAHARQHMHMLVSVDVVRGILQALLEAIELPSDLRPQFGRVERAEQGPSREAAEHREFARWRQAGHRTQRSPQREVEMQPDRQMVAVSA